MGHCNVKHFKALRYKTKSLKIACCLCMDHMHVAMHVASLILHCASLHVSGPWGSSPQSFIDNHTQMNVRTMNNILRENEIECKAQEDDVAKNARTHSQIYHTNQHLPEASTHPVQPEVVSDCCVNVLHRKATENKQIIILNMANAMQPMGLLMDGIMTQEQHLCLCSNLKTHLEAGRKIDFYNVHHPEDGKPNAEQPRIVSLSNMQVYFFRNSEYKMVQGRHVAVISAAIPDLTRQFPEAKRKQTKRKREEEPQQSKWRKQDVYPYNNALIGNLLETIEDVAHQISFQRNVDVKDVEVILSAWGCGPGQHAPQTIAEIFKQHLSSKHSDKFPKVTFAIKGSASLDM